MTAHGFTGDRQLEPPPDDIDERDPNELEVARLERMIATRDLEIASLRRLLIERERDLETRLENDRLMLEILTARSKPEDVRF